jgi:hypothetical protein
MYIHVNDCRGIQIKRSESHGNIVVAYQKYLTEQNNLLAVKVIANQMVVQAQAAARSNVAKANGDVLINNNYPESWF